MINKRLIELAKSSMKYVYATIGSQWLALICNIAIILSIGTLVQAFIDNTVAPALITATATIAVVGIIVRFLCSIATTKTSFLAADEVKLTLREAIYGKILKLGNSYYERVSTAEVLQVAVEGVDQIESYFSRYLPQLFYSLLAPITLFAVLAFINFPAALALLICVPLIPMSIVMIRKIAGKLMRQYWGTYTDLGAGFLENIQGLTTLKVYKADEAKNAEMNRQAENFRKITMRVLTMQLNSITVMDLIAYGGSAIGIAFAVTAFASGSLGFAGCFAIILLASEFFIPLRLLGSYFHITMNGMAAANKIFNLLDQPEPENNGIENTVFNDAIDFSSVDFSYDKKRQILHEVTLCIRPGINALVGESGSGKSTVAALLTGQIFADTGSVTLDGRSLNDYSQRWLRRSITYIGHSSYLFTGTVRENLLMGAVASPDPSPGDEKLWSVLEQVDLASFLKEQNGLDTVLTEQASNLSGGQRQRLALARALLHDSPIYIFDEATSNVDVESEHAITKIIWELGKTKTVLFISHRLANVIPADVISVMEQGRIVESGTHETLLAKEGVYSRMFEAQSELENIARKEAVYA